MVLAWVCLSQPLSKVMLSLPFTSAETWSYLMRNNQMFRAGSRGLVEGR